MNDRIFASDNSATVHPAVMQAMTAANTGHAVSYGEDRWTREAVETIRRHVGPDVSVFFVYNGTAANVLAVDACTHSTDAVLCTQEAHIATDECGAPERIAGVKLIAVPAEHGKLSPEAIDAPFEDLRLPHQNRPALVSITQSTELGTVYTPQEISAISTAAHRRGMLVHMDGARIANAAASLGTSLREITVDCGVDLLSLGATKNGIMFGEAVVFLNPRLAGRFELVRKQGMQLASKMRFIAAQFASLFGSDLWLENARHANRCAALLAQRLSALSGVEIVHPVEANAVFARVPLDRIAAIQDRFHFYTWAERDRVVRIMTSFDTQEGDIDQLVSAFSAING
jgi:threonine aldolase